MSILLQISGDAVSGVAITWSAFYTTIHYLTSCYNYAEVVLQLSGIDCDKFSSVPAKMCE